MKVVLSLFLLTLVISLNAQITKKVCFLGNSYTYVNDLPKLIDSIANRDGNDLIKDQNTPGGHTLNQHSTNAISLSKIASDEWDYVVLQDQSQWPSFPYDQTSISVYPKAKILCDSIRSANQCAIPLFYNTWGREVGDSQWDSINTFVKMNNRLYSAYSFMAEDNSGKLSPVGIGFRKVYDDLTGVVAHADLYSGDGSHPSIFGSYLAACIFYNVIFDTYSQGNEYLPIGITSLQANYLQAVADNVVNGVDSVLVDFTQPIADFENTITESEVYFTNTSLHAFEYSWDFGDGNSSTEVNPTYDYDQQGTYTVTLTSSYCGNQDQSSFDITIGNLGNYTNSDLELINVFPNPSFGVVNVQVNNQSNLIEVFELDGKLIRSIEATDELMRINLESGIYIIRVGKSFKKVVVLE